MSINTKGMKIFHFFIIFFSLTFLASGAAVQYATTIYVNDCNNMTCVNTSILNETALNQTSAGVWLLNANLRVNYTGVFYINSSDVTWLRINSTNNSGNANIFAMSSYGRVEINNTKITSWNTTTAAPESSSIPIRSHIYANGFYSRLNISNSNISNLGYNSGLAINSGVSIAGASDKYSHFNDTIFVDNYMVAIYGSLHNISNNVFSINPLIVDGTKINISNNKFNNTGISTTVALQIGQLGSTNAGYINVTNNTATGRGSFWITLDYNNISNNNVSSTWYDSFQIRGNYSIFLNNTAYNDASSGGVGLDLLDGAHDNVISNGSILSTRDQDYFLRNVSGNNRIINTNFTGNRTIKFNDANSWFNYSNNNGTTFVSLNVSAQKEIYRTISNWTNKNTTFKDNTTSGIVTGYYTVSGVHPDTYYSIYNNTNIDYTLLSDSNGLLSNFSIGLNATPLEISIFGDAPTLRSSAISETQIYQSSQANIITADIRGINIVNASVGITLNGVQTLYALAVTANSSIYSYSFKSGTPGLYTVSNFYATDEENRNTITAVSHPFTVVPGGGSPSIGSGNAGAGGVPPVTTKSQSANITNIISKFPNAPVLNLQTIPKTGLENIAYIALVVVGFGILSPKKLGETLIMVGAGVFFFAGYGAGWF